MRTLYCIVGKFVDFFGNLLSRFRSQYLLCNLGDKGVDVHIEKGCSITAKNVFCGNHVYIGENNLLLTTGAKIIIGNHVMLAPNVSIVTGNHRIDIVGKYMTDVRGGDKRPSDDSDVIIEDDVWIGMGAIVLKGVRIGRGSVIGAGAIISKDVPPYSVVTSVCELRIRNRFGEQQIKEHEMILNEANKGN